MIRESVEQFQLVADREFDIDAFDRIRVLTEALQRDDHVLVDLEGVGVLGDRRRAGAVQPKLAARLGIDGNEPFASARVGDAHHIGGGHRHRVFIFPDDVAKQDHLRQCAAFRFGAIADGAQITLIEMFQSTEQHPLRFGADIQVLLDFDDAWDGIARLAEEFQAHRAGESRGAVQHPACRGDEPVAAFFLHAGQAAQELVRDILAEPGLAKPPALDVEALAAQHPSLFRQIAAILPDQLEARDGRVVDLAEVVIEAGHLQPVAVGVHQAPPQ